jgi:hypothetical protein
LDIALSQAFGCVLVYGKKLGFQMRPGQKKRMRPGQKKLHNAMHQMYNEFVTSTCKFIAVAATNW